MKKNVFVVGMAVMVLTFGMVVVGCASSGSSTGSSVPIDPQFIGAWLYGDNILLELTINPDNTGALNIFGPLGRVIGKNSLQVKDSGKLLIAPNGKRMSGRIDGDKFILTGLEETPITFSKAKPIEVANTTWAFIHPNVTNKYTFANDGKYKLQGTGGGSNADMLRALLSYTDVDGTGTYSVSDYKIILKPTGGAYISLDGGGTIKRTDIETYTFWHIDGKLYLDGLYYEKQ